MGGGGGGGGRGGVWGEDMGAEVPASLTFHFQVPVLCPPVILQYLHRYFKNPKNDLIKRL